MAPLPKRKHSTSRKGKRMIARKTAMPQLSNCEHCGAPKIPHRVCKKCGK